MTVFFTSDLHFGHTRIIELCKRPFPDVVAMNAELVSRWNATVGSDDEVYVLGDFSFATPKPTHDILTALRGRKYLVRGNHDRPKALALWGEHFTWIKDYYELRTHNQLIVLSHYPFLTWNGRHHKSWSLHGHSHGTLPKDPNARRLDVGVDCHDFRPITLARVAELMTSVEHNPSACTDTSGYVAR